MSDSEGLMVEGKSRLTVLVIEDNGQFGDNAMEALKGHRAMLATTLDDALMVLNSIEVDAVLSDVHFPANHGDKARENILPVMMIALEKNIPLSVVTGADHHGNPENQDEGFVALSAFTPDQLLLSLSSPAEKNCPLMRNLAASDSITIRSDSKTPKIWGRSLDMLMNACARPKSGLGMAMKQVRKLGLSVTAKDGVPRVTLRKK
ncbi:hypothetical protein GF318_04995 [Candidatus Micrarchaeota archaeon]|nr:hypothetical protein [Candidatus Micrarchaeota archaeon]